VPAIHCPCHFVAQDPPAKVPFSRMAAMNKPEWMFGVVASAGSAVCGVLQPAFGFLMASLITVFYVPGAVRCGVVRWGGV